MLQDILSQIVSFNINYPLLFGIFMILISFIVFSMALPFALYTNEATWQDILGLPLYRLFGGLVIGSLTAFVIMFLARYLTRHTLHYTFPLMLGGIMTTTA